MGKGKTRNPYARAYRQKIAQEHANGTRTTTTEQVCNACKRLLPAVKFHKNKHALSGLTYSCAECTAKRLRENNGERTCLGCSQSFWTVSPNQKYCGHPCRTLHAKQKAAQRRCVTCWQPTTKNRFDGMCGSCAYAHQKKIRDEAAEAGASRVCVSCEEEKSVAAFDADYSKLRNICMPCEYYRDLSRTYKKPESFFRDLWASQNGHCGVCDGVITEESRALDHCHVTNEPREFTCPSCNTGMGLFRDHPDIIHRISALM